MPLGRNRADSEATKIVADFGGLVRFTSELNRVEGVDYWIVQVPVGILEEVWQVLEQLTAAIRLENIPKLAFLCRNAMELHIWALYVISSPGAAKRFHQDAYVDAMEMVKLMDKVFKHTPSELHPAVGSEMSQLIRNFEPILMRDMVGCSVAELRSMKHLQIGAIAEEVGYGPVYEVWNPILSKLVHATAYNVLVAGKDMDGIGIYLVERIVAELRSAVGAVNRYLGQNGLPPYAALL